MTTGPSTQYILSERAESVPPNAVTKRLRDVAIFWDYGGYMETLIMVNSDFIVFYRELPSPFGYRRLSSSEQNQEYRTTFWKRNNLQSLFGNRRGANFLLEGFNTPFRIAMLWGYTGGLSSQRKQRCGR